MSSRDRKAWQTFVQLADTLVADFDVIDFLDTLAQASAELVGVTAVGILLADHTGALNLVAASTEQARLLELLQLQNAEGPCLDTYRTGVPVQCSDLTAARDLWPGFAPAALAAGFDAVHALPMRLREQAIGAMNLFSTEPGALDSETSELGQALADVATIGILHERAFRRHEVVTQQLQNALHSRIVIEQAKGVLAERLQLSVEDAFTVLRTTARDRNLKLADVAGAVIRGELHQDLPDDIPRYYNLKSPESRG
jgi:transcriptional regulator with GAF, ATPase, and Fis domain